MNYHNTNTIRWTPQEGGRLVVRSRYVCYNEPKEVVTFYLIDDDATNIVSLPLTGDSPRKHAFGTKLIFDAAVGHFLTDNGVVVCTVKEATGTTRGWEIAVPIYAFTRAIPTPKGRKNSTIEWRHGSWQKFLEPRTWQEV